MFIGFIRETRTYLTIGRIGLDGRFRLAFSLNEGGRWAGLHLELRPRFYFYVFLFGFRFALCNFAPNLLRHHRPFWLLGLQGFYNSRREDLRARSGVSGVRD